MSAGDGGGGDGGGGVPADRAAWEDDMLRRLLALEQPVMQGDMVNFVVGDDVSERLVGFVVSPSAPTDLSHRPRRGCEPSAGRKPSAPAAPAADNMAVTKPSSSTAVVLSYRAAYFLSGGFDLSFERLPSKQQAALAHFYSVRTTQVLSSLFEALADRPLRVNVHHVHRLWQACVYFGRAATLDFFAAAGEDAMALCLSALLDVADYGAVAAMYRDIAELFASQPMFSSSSSFSSSVFFGGRSIAEIDARSSGGARRRSTTQGVYADKTAAVATAVGECGVLHRAVRAVCGDEGGDRSPVHCAAVADLHAQLVFDMARRVEHAPILESIGREAGPAFEAFVDLLERASDACDNAGSGGVAASDRGSGGGGGDRDAAVADEEDGTAGEDTRLLDASVQSAAAVLEAVLDCCSRELLEGETDEFGDDPVMETNHLHPQRSRVCAAGAAAVPALCRYARAAVARQRRQTTTAAAACRYTLPLDGVLSVLVQLLRDDPGGTAGAVACEGMCAELCDWAFLFPRSSMFQQRFKQVFALAVIQGNHQGFCEAVLAPEAEGGADMLTRMVHFCEGVDAAEEAARVRTENNIHTSVAGHGGHGGGTEAEGGLHGLQQRGLLALMLSCLNILRLKATEMRTAVADDDQDHAGGGGGMPPADTPSALLNSAPATPGRVRLSEWLLPFLDAHADFARYMPRLLERTRAMRPPSGSGDDDQGHGGHGSPAENGGDGGGDGAVGDGSFLMLSDFETEVERLERSSIDLGSDFARDLGFRAS